MLHCFSLPWPPLTCVGSQNTLSPSLFPPPPTHTHTHTHTHTQQSQQIPPDLAEKTFEEFDKRIVHVMKNRLKNKITFEASSPNYRQIDEVWTIWLKNLVLTMSKMDGKEKVKVDKAIVFAIKQK